MKKRGWKEGYKCRTIYLLRLKYRELSTGQYLGQIALTLTLRQIQLLVHADIRPPYLDVFG